MENKMNKKNILLKLAKAREIVKKSRFKKDGRNDYSNYDYYTPELVEKIVSKACETVKIICLCNLKADELGLYQEMDVVDLENNNEKITFQLRTKQGSMKATNDTQQLGGTDTYSERYIKMKVFQIKDNSLDFDNQNNTSAANPIYVNKKTYSKQNNTPMSPF